MLLSKAKDPAFWQTVRSDAAYQPMITHLRSIYESSFYNEIPALPYHARMRFYCDGDRSEFEAPYFRRRAFLASAALLFLIYPEETHYLNEVHQVLWAICDEYTWALPAHTNGTLEDDLTNVDLFNAETGFTLAELCYVLGDRLDPLAKARAEQEVRKRVIQNYLHRTFWWDTGTNNWAAVCAGNVGGAMMYLEPELFKQQLPRLLDTMRCFLSGFPEDGTCMEGFGYWHYGFGNYLWFADLLHQFTNGEMDLLTWPKIEAIAGYAQRSFLRGGSTISFSDGSQTGKADYAMVHYLARRFPESVQLLPPAYSTYSKGNVTWMQSLRNLLYVDFHAVAPEKRLENYDLPDAGQVIINEATYSLAVKAGDNDEPHNHNDVGSFILSTNEGQILCDLGAGTYTRQYFRPETRYSIFCNSSLSHNVPIVNGQAQLPGSEYRGTITHKDSVISIDFAAAYGQPGFAKLTRRLEYSADKIILIDSFAPDYENLTERFVSFFKPEIKVDHVRIAGITLFYDPACAMPSIKEEIHPLHGFKGEVAPVYCVDFELKPGLKQILFTIKI